MDNSQPKAPMAAQPEQDQALKAAKRREDFKNMQSRVLEMMKPENRRKPVVINSLEEFLVMNAANKSLSSSDLNVRMDGYPATDPERVALVAQLTAAITDFTDVVEKPVDENAGETTAVTTVRNLADYEVQLLAWKILIAVCDAHRGRRNIPSWPTRTVLLRKVYKSFGDRFRDVKEAVARSKGLVRNIMDSDVHYVRRLAEGPRNKLHSKKGDWQARLTKSARKGTKSKETVDESSANDDGGGGNTTSERSHGPQPPGLFNQQQFAGARDQAHVRHQPHPAWSADYALVKDAPPNIKSIVVLTEFQPDQCHTTASGQPADLCSTPKRARNAECRTSSKGISADACSPRDQHQRVVGSCKLGSLPGGQLQQLRWVGSWEQRRLWQRA